MVSESLCNLAQNTDRSDKRHRSRKVYRVDYFISIMGGTTSYLSLCMGVCPRDNYTNACKLENVDFHIEDSLVNYIDAMYETKTAK